MDYKVSGFTLIELMITVAVVGILAAIALPAYHDFTVRARITEGFSLATDIKTQIAMYGRLTPPDLANTVNEWNSRVNNKGIKSKYVESVLADNRSGVITITYNAVNVGIEPNANTLVLTPLVRDKSGFVTLPVAFSTANMNSIDWACSSATHQSATSTGMIDIQKGTLLAKYAPSTCR